MATTLKSTVQLSVDQSLIVCLLQHQFCSSIVFTALENVVMRMCTESTAPFVQQFAWVNGIVQAFSHQKLMLSHDVEHDFGLWSDLEQRYYPLLTDSSMPPWEELLTATKNLMMCVAIGVYHHHQSPCTIRIQKEEEEEEQVDNDIPDSSTTSESSLASSDLHPPLSAPVSPKDIFVRLCMHALD